MNIEISDEMIEKIVREQVKAKVNALIAEKTKENPFWFWDMCKDSVRVEVLKTATPVFIEGTCKELAQSNIAEAVVERFADKIRTCFEY